MKIYGPVFSWRLGRSLGVDLVEAPYGFEKKCSFDCLYCQLGKLSFPGRIPENIPVSEEDLEKLKSRIDETKPDFITFSGEGEPTLNLNLGEVARKIRRMTPIPVALLTNSSFLNDPVVKENVSACDLVIAKLDAPEQSLFELINRPAIPLKLEEMIGEITSIRTELAVQTLLFHFGKMTNADSQSLENFCRMFNRMKTQKLFKIFLGTAHRPSGHSGMRPLAPLRLKTFAQKLRKQTGLEVVCFESGKSSTLSRTSFNQKIGPELMDLLKRRPCSEDEIFSLFEENAVRSLLKELSKKGMVEKRKSGNRFFFQTRSY